jgi:hypothetical protein
LSVRWIALSIVLAGCGGSLPPTEVVPDRTVELALRAADGTFIDVGDLRGGVVLLFMLGTYDGTSQMALIPLRAFHERHPEVEILGIDVEPSARLLIQAYQESLEIPFPITYDPNERLTGGHTALGQIDTVPTMVMLDTQGIERARRTGLVSEEQLEQMLESAR